MPMSKLNAARSRSVNSRWRVHRARQERVRRRMMNYGVRAQCQRKLVVTIDSEHHLPSGPDLVQRNFTPPESNQVYSGGYCHIASVCAPPVLLAFLGATL